MFGIDPLTAGTLVILAASGGEGFCKMPKPAEINVIPKSKEIVYDYSKSLAELQDNETATINPYGFGGTSIHQGFAANPITTETSVSMDYQLFPQHNVACVWYDRIDITMTIEPKITIAKEVREDPCRYQSVLEHEMKHVTVARKVANKYASEIGKKVYAELAKRGFMAGPVYLEQAPQIQDRMRKTVHQIIEFQHKKMEIDYAELQGQVDTLEEYERVSNLCKDTPSPSEAFIEQSRKRR